MFSGYYYFNLYFSDDMWCGAFFICLFATFIFSVVGCPGFGPIFNCHLKKKKTFRVFCVFFLTKFIYPVFLLLIVNFICVMDTCGLCLICVCVCLIWRVFLQNVWLFMCKCSLYTQEKCGFTRSDGIVF